MASSLLRFTSIRVIGVISLWVGVIVCFQSMPAALRWPARAVWLLASLWLVIGLISAIKNTRFTLKKTAFILIVVAMQYLCLALLCRVFITVMGKRDDRLTTRGLSTLTPDCIEGIKAMLSSTGFNQFSPEMGWELRPGKRTPNYTINQQGFRRSTEVNETPADPAKRYLCMGDSFTFGTAVADNETYPAHAEQLLPGTEWLNFGIPGTCLTQSYLHYRQHATKFNGRHVIIGFMSNDAMRTVNCFRPFLNADSGAPLTKPFVRIRDGKFSLEPNPYTSADDYQRLLSNDRVELDKLRRLDYLSWSLEKTSTNPIARTLSYIADVRQLDKTFDAFFDANLPFSATLRTLLPQDPYGPRAIYRPGSDAFAAITGLFDLYYQQVIADGRKPLIVLLPGPLDVQEYVQKHPCQYASLVEHLRSKHYAYLDFLDPLIAKHQSHLTTNALFVQSHFKSAINKELAQEIIKALSASK